MEWSEQQKAIFRWFEHPQLNKSRSLVTVARAGTGKTTTILEGIDRAPEGRIMLAAFARPIAQVLKEKLRNPRAEARTLHAFGYSTIRRFWNKAAVDEKRIQRIAENVLGSQAPDEMKEMTAKLATKAKEMAPYAKQPADLYELATEFDCVPDEEWEEDGWDLEAVSETALTLMKASLKADGTVDFADMLYIPIANKWIRGRYDLVVIDEAQDMNVSQIILATKSVVDGGRLAVIGDDRQAIFGFRGADSGVLGRIATQTRAELLSLNITYRCPQNIVALARKIVPDYQAAPTAPAGEVLSQTEDDAIAEMQPGDYLISRTNAPLVGFCLKILRTNKRARINGKDIGKGLLALVTRLRARSIPEFLGKLAHWEVREVTRAEASEAKNKEVRIERIRDQAEMLRSMTEGLSGIRELQTRIEELFSDNGQPAVLCSSIHRIKGLESERVFILKSTLRSNTDPPCTCGHWAHEKECPRCPCEEYQPDEKKRLEETNLEYVAVTRSKNRLTWILGEF